MKISSTRKKSKLCNMETSNNTQRTDREVTELKTKNVIDDGTMTYFWRTHTVTVLLVLIVFLIYSVGFYIPSDDNHINTKRGLLAAVLFYLLFGILFTPDGPFRRPHPILWRFVLCLGTVYQISLIFMLLQSPREAREMMKHLDSSLGIPLTEKEYGGDGACLIYDTISPENPFHNVWEKMDLFVICHFIGWWFKTLVLRDYWLCLVISLFFELLEYTLEHKLPNFSECWWDHWIMDALVCNMAGIYLGMRTLNYLSMKTYHWRGLWNIPTYRGKISRIFNQFLPYDWTDYEWNATSSLKRWLIMLLIIGIFLLAEINSFYIKFVLWIPPKHYLNLARLVFFLLMASVALREAFQFLHDTKTKKMGPQSWLIIVIIFTEALVCYKLDTAFSTRPLPDHIIYLWVFIFSCLIIYTICKYLSRSIYTTFTKFNILQHKKCY
ncbi:hypothetical protein A3Q56_01429 [Intoshia linei]|uniref:Phosphatidylserine synthase n=1 Tax=Intoshia linei TaxID=1819745 RepID=A0A177B9H0_9BILA|nr:hypothetical protein A3Q56_01429 [Intoshia linei]